MNFLALCKRVRQECGIAGSGPTAVTGQSGEMQRVVDWTAQAWMEIQQKRTDWDWMRKEFSFETVAGTREYVPSSWGPTPFTDVNFILEDTVRIYKKSVGVADEQYIDFWDFDSFRDTFMFGVQQQQRPSVLAIRPRDRAVMVGDKPDDVYVIYGDYMKQPVALAQNTDTPEMPEKFHLLIVYRAMLKYAGYENATEVERTARIEGGRMARDLVLDQGGEWSFGDPLA